jgi:hypothetical protein
MATGSFEVCDEEFFRQGEELSALEAEHPVRQAAATPWIALGCLGLAMFVVLVLIAM